MTAAVAVAAARTTATTTINAVAAVAGAAALTVMVAGAVVVVGVCSAAAGAVVVVDGAAVATVASQKMIGMVVDRQTSDPFLLSMRMLMLTKRLMRLRMPMRLHCVGRRLVCGVGEKNHDHDLMMCSVRQNWRPVW